MKTAATLTTCDNDSTICLFVCLFVAVILVFLQPVLLLPLLPYWQHEQKESHHNHLINHLAEHVFCMSTDRLKDMHKRMGINLYTYFYKCTYQITVASYFRKWRLILSRLPLVIKHAINPLNAELNPICYLLALLGAHHFLHVSRIRVKSLTLRPLMSYIYGAPILDVSRSHTTTQHSR